MSELHFDFGKITGNIKPMHGVNNGPIIARRDQTRGNFDLYKAAGIPFARTHDAAFCSAYGGSHTIDVHAIFPDFSKDPCDPASYDFPITDKYVKEILSAGTQVFYRLGAKIEHECKKYGTLPPADYHKWAVICEHIIAHYNEGWADGFELGIKYWEIWNEPDLDPDDSKNKRCWGGTAREFYEFFRIALVHLKKRFPGLMIGGPAIAGEPGKWVDGLLDALTRDGERIPLDFFSWHIYSYDPYKIAAKAERVRKKLDQYGYTDTVSILNEWNYVENWDTKFVKSIEAIIGMKGAAFTLATMLLCHGTSADILMYYDARPSVFNGLFDLYTYRPLHGYYPFVAFNELYKLGKCVESSSDDKDITLLGATDGNGNDAAAVCYYSFDENAPEKEVVIDIENGGDYVYQLSDEENDLRDMGALPKKGGKYVLTLKPESYVLIKKA